MSVQAAARALVAVVGAATLIAPSAQAADLDEKVGEVTKILQQRQQSGDAVPASVYRDARCVASLEVVKAGLGIGGQASNGLVSCRAEDGSWSAPSFFSVSGLNVGLQAGVEKMEAVLVFTSDESREALLNKTKFTLGADAGIAAGPVGEGAGAAATGGAAVLSYQDSKGLYAGVTLDGMVLSHNKEKNEEAYGEGATPAKILNKPGKSAPALTRPFPAMLDKEMPIKAKTSG